MRYIFFSLNNRSKMPQTAFPEREPKLLQKIGIFHA